MAIPLHRMDSIPRSLAGIGVREIGRVLEGPTLIEIAGDIDPPVFLSVLLHGNETTSFEVLQHVRELAAAGKNRRSLMIFVGNVDAAAEGKRHLPGQPDFNRIWGSGASEHHELAQRVLEAARRRGLFASIDIHNNTGRNPVYGCVNALRPNDLNLAALFAPLGVYYLNPPTTQSIAFSRICPAVTVECGQSGDREGYAAAAGLVERVIGMEAFPPAPPKPSELQLYQTVGRVLVDTDAEVSFGGPDADLVLREDLEDLNFRRIGAGELWARSPRRALPLRVVNEHGTDLTGEFFTRRGPDIVLWQDVVPSMVTRDRDIIRQDCLCYLMRPLDRPA